MWQEYSQVACHGPERERGWPQQHPVTFIGHQSGITRRAGGMGKRSGERDRLRRTRATGYADGPRARNLKPALFGFNFLAHATQNGMGAA